MAFGTRDIWSASMRGQAIPGRDRASAASVDLGMDGGGLMQSQDVTEPTRLLWTLG